MIDFSYTPFPDQSWTWALNIPAGLSWDPDTSWKPIVLALQRKYGCLNVSSSNANPPHRDQIGVYYRDHDGRHRDKLCTCFEGVNPTRWPPK